MKVTELAAHLRELVAVQADLAVLTTGIVYIQDPLGMAVSPLAFGTAFGMKGLAMDQGAAEDVAEVGDLGEEPVEL